METELLFTRSGKSKLFFRVSLEVVLLTLLLSTTIAIMLIEMTTIKISGIKKIVVSIKGRLVVGEGPIVEDDVLGGEEEVIGGEEEVIGFDNVVK